MKETFQDKDVQVGEHKILDFDDVECVLNLTQSTDLEHILRLTPKRNRIEVALSFTAMTKRYWFFKAGVIQKGSHYNYITRWLDKHARLPLGVAFRLSKVLGVSCEILFEDYA